VWYVQGKANPLPVRPPRPEDVHTFCYTSGTTGEPKGAMLTHANAIAMVAGALHAGIDLSASDVHLSYLPLAHVFERLVQALCWTVGAAVGFYQVGVHPLAPCDGACDRGD
jgi:long-chain acyl-CoA synthetase